MNIQSTRGKVLTATAACGVRNLKPVLSLSSHDVISLPLGTRKMSKRKSATIFDFGGLSGAKMVMMVRHVNGGETCGTVLQY